MDRCVNCGIELSRMERNRTECWECQVRAYEAYEEDQQH